MTIFIYNITSRLLANGPRIDITTDIILKDILNIRPEKFCSIVIVGQDQKQIHDNGGEMNVSINEQSVSCLICEQAFLQVVEGTMINQINSGVGATGWNKMYHL